MIGSAPLFEEVLAEYEVAGFEAAVNRLKSDLLKYSNDARNLAAAVKQQLEKVEKGKTDDSDPVVVPDGLVLAAMHWSLDRAEGHAGKSPSLTVTGDEATGFLLELGGWRAGYDDRSDAQSDAAYFWTAVDRASDLDEIEAVRESRVRCGEALAEVISTLKLKVRRKI